MPTRTYGIAGVAYSDNLGDGIIAECLQFAIKQNRPSAEIEIIDISGRTEYSHEVVRNKSAKLAMLRRMPKWCANLVMAAGISKIALRSSRTIWRPKLKAVDALVIGGGHLLLDKHLNFPIKLAVLSRLAKAESVPVALHAVGVSTHWSSIALKLFRPLVLRAADARVSVRDRQSANLLTSHLNRPEMPVEVVRDPGVLASRMYGLPAGEGVIDVAINLSDPSELATYSDEAGGDYGTEFYVATWLKIITALITEGRSITVFTNGAIEDEAFKAVIVEALGAQLPNPLIHIAPRPTIPSDLAAIISRHKVLVAHRLHANVIGYSYGLGLVGLLWDSKLASFFESVSLSSACISARDFGPDRILDAIRRAPHPNSADRMKVMDEAHADVEQTLRALDLAVEQKA